ncbi:MAG: helix-turn-helix domain-containing protein [Mangrovibacterium sp.]
MNERIKQFMDRKGLSPSEFADAISVQRSNITHILHGRNNPGFQFITKMLEKFPDINARWLLTGEGEMIVQERSENPPDLFSALNTKPGEMTESARRETTGNAQPMPEILQPVNSERNKTIELIVTFYTDQTFKQYTPSK